MSAVEKIERITEARAWRGKMPLTGRYTAGIAGERFFREIKDNARIMGTCCPKCGITYVPARLYCERCFAKLEEWVEIPPTGTVHTFTIVNRNLDDEPLEEPEIIAFIRLDNSDGGLVHRLSEISPAEVHIGMRVEAVFKPEGEREGSVLDIKYFKPAS